MLRRATTLTAAIAGLTLFAGCASGAQPAARTTDPVVRSAVVEVYKSPDCSCCHDWEAYLTRHGYQVRSIPTADMTAVKNDSGVPAETWSCHTAMIDGYVVEGHVPVEAIEDLLSGRPAVDGIGLPGMPPGSPGMPGEKVRAFEVLAFADGTTSSFGSY